MKDAPRLHVKAAETVAEFLGGQEEERRGAIVARANRQAMANSEHRAMPFVRALLIGCPLLVGELSSSEVTFAAFQQAGGFFEMLLEGIAKDFSVPMVERLSECGNELGIDRRVEERHQFAKGFVSQPWLHCREANHDEFLEELRQTGQAGEEAVM